MRSSVAKYGYCHSQVFSDNFPARPFNGETQREIVLLTFDRPMSSEDATAEVTKQGLERPTTRMRSTSGSNTRKHSWKRRFPSSMTIGLATMAAATLCLWSNYGGGNWVWKGLTTSGRNITGWHSCVRWALTQDR